MNQEPYAIRFGDPHLHSMTIQPDLELPITDRTAMDLWVNPANNSGMMKLGGVRITGAAENIRRIAAGFARIDDELTGARSAATDELARNADPLSECDQCGGVHRPSEGHVKVTVAGVLEEAYQLISKSYCLSQIQAALLLESAFRFIVTDETPAARSLLHFFVHWDMADRLTRMLEEVHRREPERQVANRAPLNGAHR